MIAPIESPARSTPNARPSCSGGTAPASSASLAGDRAPRAVQATARPTATAGHDPAKATEP